MSESASETTSHNANREFKEPRAKLNLEFLILLFSFSILHFYLIK